jgi:DNA processing protein
MPSPTGNRPSAIGNRELAAWVALHSVPGMGAATLARLLARFRTPEGVLAATAEELAAVARVPQAVARGIREAAAAAGRSAAAVERLEAAGAWAVGRGQRAYPSRLNALASPPPLLYVRGRLPSDQRRTFGIVGTTHPSAQGRHAARTVARALARQGWIIVSGHARGIDEAAHRGALEARRPTLLVLPTGILQFRPRPGYPPEAELWRRAAAVSEWHPDAPWQTPLALARNRLIAALSDCLLVVETREQGGAMTTLRHAVALGRRTFVVRFHAPDLSAVGNPRAEAIGAEPVHSLRDLESRLYRPPRRPGQQELEW